MKSEKFYEDWKRHRSQIEVAPDFAETVMERVSEYEQKKSAPFWDLNPVFEFISTNPFARLALFVSGGLLGLARIAFIISMFLRPC